MALLYTDDLHTFTHVFLSADCPKNAGTTENSSGASGCSPARSYEGKSEETAACRKAIIVTVCNNTEAINQLLSAGHSSVLTGEPVNGNIGPSKPVSFSLPGICPALATRAWRCLGVRPHSFLHLFHQLCGACAPSIRAGCISPCWEAASAAHTPFPHVSLTSPLKDGPHSKLLFKGKKKYTGRRKRGCRVCEYI